MPKLTKRVVDSAKPGGRDVFIWDNALPGFGLRVFRSGKRSYLIQYRADGRTRRFTLGPHGVLTPDQARRRAARLLADVREGKDPAEARQQALVAPTLAELAERYLADYARPKKRPRSAAEDRRILERYILPILGARQVASLVPADIDRLHASMLKTPIQANRTLALLSTVLQLAERWAIRAPGTNPCRGVERYAERRRERFLSAAEIERLGEVLRRVDREGIELPAVVNAVRLLILTGARRGEILGLRWQDVDFEVGVLRIADSKTGPKTIPLNAPALEVLARLPKTGVWVFEGRGGEPVKLSSPWERIRKLAELEDVRMHDLRHSFASIGAGSGMGLPVIGKLLGHSQPSTTARYAHLADDPVRRASEVIGQRISAFLDGKPPGKLSKMGLTAG